MNRLKILVGNKESKSICGVLKSSPDDFIVDEIPLYEPCGEGEHLYVHVRKTNMSHDELIRRVAKAFGVSKRDIGAAGRKDLRAVTTQTLSVHLPGKQIIVPENIGSIEVLSSSLHTNKLRLGHLTGNRFSILIRTVSTKEIDIISDRLEKVAKIGLPNAFGPQRFGNRNNNHTLGHLMILEKWDDLIEELLAGEERHHTFALQKEYAKALDAWPFGQPAERNVLEAIVHGKTPKQACKSINRGLRTLWVQAFQSAIFNDVLQRRHQNGTWNTIIEGDLVWNQEGGGRTFEINQLEVGSEEIVQRLNSFALSPSGPLWGAKMRLPSGEVLKLEQNVMSTYGVNDTHLGRMKQLARGARRPLRVQVRNPSVQTGLDTHGDYVEVKFELQAGSYATVVIEKLLNGEF